VLRFIILWAIGHGIILWLNERGIYLDQWVARMIGEATSPDTLTSISWILSGLFALTVTIVWEAFQVSDKTTTAIKRRITQPSALPSAGTGTGVSHQIMRSSSLNAADKPETQGEERVSANITSDNLRTFYRGRTQIEGDRLAEPYINKWITLEDKVTNISLKNFPNGYQITCTDNFVYALFDFSNKWKNRIELLRVGDVITVCGKITSVNSSVILLTDCELINIQSSS
jgi:hypothetical protein